MSRPFNVPAAAECLSSQDFIVQERTPSRLVPGAQQIEFRLRCPRCGHKRPLAGTYSKFNCGGCGLAMQVDFAVLYIWPEADDPVRADMERVDA